MARLRFLWAFVLSLVASQSALEAQTVDDDAAWQATIAAGTVEAFEQFLRRYPTSRHASIAFCKLVALETIDDNPDAFQALQTGGLLGSVCLPQSFGTAGAERSTPLSALFGAADRIAPAAGPAVAPLGATEVLLDIY